MGLSRRRVKPWCPLIQAWALPSWDVWDRQRPPQGHCTFRGLSNVSEERCLFACSHRGNQFMACSPLPTGLHQEEECSPTLCLQFLADGFVGLPQLDLTHNSTAQAVARGWGSSHRKVKQGVKVTHLPGDRAGIRTPGGRRTLTSSPGDVAGDVPPGRVARALGPVTVLSCSPGTVLKQTHRCRCHVCKAPGGVPEHAGCP